LCRACPGTARCSQKHQLLNRNDYDLFQMTKANITRDQSRDTGMAMVLLLLIVRMFVPSDTVLIAALALQILNMTVPQAFKYVAVVWLGGSHLLGTVVSTIVLSIVFLVVVTPVAVIRRVMGFDSLATKAFKAGQGSVLIERHHTFTPDDVDKPY
jgi:hypothetical protein